MAVVCEICGKKFKNRAGLAGHLLIVHQKKSGLVAEVEEAREELNRLKEVVKEVERRLEKHEKELEELWKVVKGGKLPHAVVITTPSSRGPSGGV